ncbi:MAG TPA: hypothetical protein VGC37_18955 [Friedmanniella sp.]
MLGALALLVVLAIAVGLAVTRPWASTKDRTDVAAPAAGDRVLQSVDVTVQPDGALTRVGDTVVIARAAGGKADTYTTTYDPTKVVDQLPVRVLTTYQTDQGSGTDLADLKGYTGHVTINLQVQNLTVRSQQITYDVAGTSQTTTALVGAPLTVVASAALPGVDPATVVTAAADSTTTASSDTGSTNGVLSQAQDRTTQVQWASILAPPQLDATANFRVVLDARDFVVPTVDLSVQPGLVTDPTVGALIDSAFNPKNSSELALETRTIKLIGDVNDVLGRASSTISGVRKTLDASSKTLGTKTVESLTQDTKTLSSSLKTSSGDIDSLGQDLKQSLQTSQSATLQRMSDTVSQLQDVIGDTSGSVTASGGEGGCSADVKTSGGGDGVYGNLQRVVAQLAEYQTATLACKKTLQDSIQATIGTVDTATGEPECTDTPNSVVCTLQEAQDKFSDAVTDVTTALADGTTAATDLDPGRAGTAAAQLQDVSGRLAALVDGLLGDRATSEAGQGLQKGIDVAQLADLDQTLAAVIGTPGGTDPSLTTVDASLAAVLTGVQDINKTARDDADEVGAMLDQNESLAKRLCALQGGTTPGTLTPAEVKVLRGYLVTDGCSGDDPADPPIPPPGGKAMSTRLDAQRTAWSTLEDQTKSSGRLVSTLTASRQDLADLTSRLTDARKDLRSTTKELGDVLADVNRARKQADTHADDLASLSDDVAGVDGRYDRARAALAEALEAATTAASTAKATSLQDEIKKVGDQGTASAAELGQAFDRSAQGLGAAAQSLDDGAVKTLKKQQSDLADQGKDDESSLDTQTKAGLSTISGSVTSATRDLDSTRTSLSKDLNNVLLDLGNPDQPDKGLRGTLGKSARAADSADFQLGLASDTASSYASVRSQEVGGILLRQAQAEAALQRQAELPAFATDLPANISHRTIYLFHLGSDR